MLLVIVFVRSSKINIVSNSVAKKINDFDQYYKVMKFREKETVLNNNTKLDANLVITDENNDSLIFNQLFVGNDDLPKIIIRYSAFACDICLEEELKIINSYLYKIRSDNIIILVSDHNMRSLKVLKNSLSLDIKIYQLKETGITFETKYKNLFVFVIDKKLNIRDFFIPEKTLPELSKNYYETICSKYFIR
jgi:hypothetical protein